MRAERDSMGEMQVPDDALWGASTQRAVENFPIAGRGLPERFVRALGLVKAAAAATNAELGVIDAEIARYVEAAAREVAEGRHDRHFVVDVFQTGSGTSSNMNANEVIANRAMQLRGGPEPRIHPNDHVNASQSSNDVIPTALHVAVRLALHEELLPALARLEDALSRRAERFRDVVKIGRTHLMDATPMRLAHEVGGWARQVELAARRVEHAGEELAELALGGTAVGTGLNCPPGFAERAIARLSEDTGLPFREAEDHFEAQGARDAAVSVSGAVRSAAVALYKIANDVRLLGSGPRCGIGELRLPAIQPGSSIMPGKVNPVLCESVTQVACQVIGHDAAVASAGLGGQLELNVYLPVIADNLLSAAHLLARVCDVFREKCIEGLEADRERAAGLVEGSLAMVTVLAPRIGYDAAAEVAKEAFASGRSVREVCRERALLPEAELAALLDPARQAGD